MSKQFFKKHAESIAEKAGDTVMALSVDGDKYIALFLSGSKLIANSVTNKVTVRWGSGHQAQYIPADVA